MENPEVIATEPIDPALSQTPVVPEPQPSLKEHRAQYPDARSSTGMIGTPPPVDTPDPQKPKPPRHRARSQDATPDELQQISILGKEARDAEDAVSESLGLKPTDGESPRLFELRRRKAIAQAVKDLKAAQAAVVPSAVPAAPSVPPMPAPRAVPSVAAAEPDPTDTEKYPYGFSDPKFQKDLIVYQVTEALQAEETKRQTEVLQREQEAGKQRFAERWAAAEQDPTYPNFRAIASQPIPWQKGDPIDLWIWARPYGPKLLYYLLHPDHVAETRDIMALGVDDQLERLVALGNAISKPAGVNGSTGALNPPPVIVPSPRPPTPVKTGPIRSSGAPPDTTQGPLSAHRAQYPGHRRR